MVVHMFCDLTHDGMNSNSRYEFCFAAQSVNLQLFFCFFLY